MKSSTALSTAIRTSSRSSDPGGAMKLVYTPTRTLTRTPLALGFAAPPARMRVTEPAAAAGALTRTSTLKFDFCSLGFARRDNACLHSGSVFSPILIAVAFTNTSIKKCEEIGRGVYDQNEHREKPS